MWRQIPLSNRLPEHLGARLDRAVTGASRSLDANWTWATSPPRDDARGGVHNRRETVSMLVQTPRRQQLVMDRDNGADVGEIPHEGCIVIR